MEYAAFYLAEMPRLIRYLMKCGASAHDAAEAAQRSFVVLLEKWETVHSPAAWLRTVAFREFLHRPARNEYPLEPDYDGRSVLPASEGIDVHEVEQALLDALRQLSLPQRQVFALHYDQFETREIAEILQMKEAAVRQNLARARAKLREIPGLTQLGFTPGKDGPALGSEGGI